MDIDVNGQTVTFMQKCDLEKMSPEVDETISLTTPEGENILLKFTDLKKVSTPVLKELSQKYSIADWAIADKFTNSSTFNKKYTTRTAIRLENELADCTKDKCSEKQMEILKAVKKLVEEGKVKTLFGFVFDEMTLLSDRDIQKVLREVEDTNSEKIAEFEQIAEPYNNLLTIVPDPKDDEDSEYERKIFTDKTSILADFLDFLKFESDYALNDDDFSLDDCDPEEPKECEKTMEKEIAEYKINHHLTDEYVDKVRTDYESLISSYYNAKSYLIASGLKNSSFEVQNKILYNMSKRCAADLRSAMQYVNPTLEESAAIQESWCEIVRRLEDNGSLVIVRNGDCDIIY